MFRLFLRGTSVLLATAFVMLLMATAWQHCWPDPYAALYKKQAHTVSPSKFRGPHHVCAALKDWCDALPTMHLHRSGSFEFRAEVSLFGNGFAIEKDRLSIHDLSPPCGSSARSILPLFKLNSNLRI